MARPKNEDNSLPPEHLKLSQLAVDEWVRMAKILKKKQMFQDSDRVLMEFYIVNYQNFVFGNQALAALEDEQREAQALQVKNIEEAKVKASILKSIRTAKRSEQDNVNTAISRGMGLSQKLYLNPNDRRKGKISENPDKKDPFSTFLDD